MKSNITGGTLPLTGIIELESIKDQWQLVANGLIPKLVTTGIIIDSIKKRVQLEIDYIANPDRKLVRTDEVGPTPASTMNPTDMGGVSRIQLFLHNEMEKGAWTFLGKIKGKNEIPIVIMYYEALNKAFYSLKKETEDTKVFAPFNPQMN